MPLTASQKLTRSAGRQLTSILPRRKTGISPDTLLPIEIWDCIFHELPDDPLLRISMTCRTFNALCMPIYLVRKGIPSESLGAGDLAISSGLVKAVQLSFYTPPIECLSCHLIFWSRFHEHLTSLRNLIRRSKSIRRLELIFNGDLAISHGHGSLKPVSPKILLNLFRDIVYSMSQRFNGPVVVVGLQDIFSCRARDIRSWNLHQFHFYGGLGNYFRHLFRARHSNRTTIRLHNGTSAYVSPIHSIISAHIYEIPPITRRPSASSTLIVLNHEYITSLVLGYTESSIRHSIVGDELTVVLPCLILPALRTITLNTDSIDPTVLSQFLSRHKSLQSLEYDAKRSSADAAPLITPALALPELTRINAKAPANLIRLLDALDASPRLANFSFSFDRSSPTTPTALNTLLRRLAQRTTDTQLQLILPVRIAAPLDADERALAASLACVRAVHLQCLQRDAARDMLLWLALLPRLQQVDFAFLKADAGAGEDNASLVREIHAALAPSVEVDVSLIIPG
ncbi:hypothetical protein FB451DRAFT_1359110, partial [Mycena latifolia]